MTIFPTAHYAGRSLAALLAVCAGCAMPFESLAASLGWRYAFAGRSSLSFIGNVAIGGLALSIAVLVVVVSVVNGFERELEKRVFAVLPHLGIHGWQPVPNDSAELDKLESLSEIRAAAPIAQAIGLAAGTEKVQGMLLNGIDPSGYGRVSELERYISYQHSPALSEALRPGAFHAVVGARLAGRLGLGFGDKVTLVVPDATITPAGALPRQKRFEIVGLLQSQSELDNRAVFVHLNDAQRLLRLGNRIHGYQVKVRDFHAARQVGWKSQAALGSDRFYARPWTQTHGNLHHAIRVQKTTMFVLLAFLVAVAAFNLVSTLVMAVEQRGADIAILKTMGAPTSSLMGGFVLLGSLIGGIGVAVGLAAGYVGALALPELFAWLSDTFNADLMNRYFITYLPVDLRGLDFLAIGATAFALCLLSTVFPARRAASLLPREVLIHE